MAPSKTPASALGGKKKQASLFSFFGKPKVAAKKPVKDSRQLSERKETPTQENLPSQKPAVIAPSQPSPAPTKNAKTVPKKPLTSNKSKSSKKRPKSLKRKKTAPSKDQLRRRAVLEDTDEEEFLNDEDDPSDFEESGSEFEAGGSEEESELEYDEDDDEESEAPPPRKARRTSTSSATVRTKTPLSSAKKTPPVRTAPSWSRRVTPSDSVGLDSIKKQMMPASSFAVNETATPLRAQATDGKPPPFVKSALNPGGSHLHNHLSFVQNPRDSRGRTPDDPNYDCRTLRVNKMEFKKVNDGAMTAAVEQWWDLRSEYNDCVLLFKTGKFYEMFHMDADVGVRGMRRSLDSSTTIL